MPIFKVAASGPVPAFNLVGGSSRVRLVSDTPGTIELSTDANGYLRLTSAGLVAGTTVTDNTSAVAYTLDTTLAITAAGAKLLSIGNNGVEKASFSKDGGLSITGVASGAAALTIPSGSRILFDGAATRYLEWNGSTLAFNGSFSVGIQSVICGMVYPGATSGLTLRGRVADGATAVGVRIAAVNALSTAGAKIVSFYNDDSITEKAYIDLNGTIVGLGYITPGGNYGIRAASGSSLLLSGWRGDGATAIGVAINNTNTLSTAGAKLLSIQNNSTEKAYFTYDGQLVANGVATANGYNLSAGLSGTGTLQAQKHYAPSFPADVRGGQSDAAASVGVKLGSETAWTTAGAKLLSIQNAVAEKAYFDLNGALTILGSDSVGNSIVVPTNGRINFDGAGSLSTYIAWNGSTLITPRAFAMPGCYTPLIFPNSASDLQIRGRLAAGNASAGNIKIGSVNVLTGTDKIISFYSDSFVTERAFIDLNGGAYFGGSTTVNNTFYANASYANTYYDRSGTGLLLKSQAVDGAAAVSAVLDSFTAFTVAGSKLLSIRSAGAEKAYINKDGGYSTNAVSQLHGGVQCAVAGVYNDGYSWLDPTFLLLSGPLAGGQQTISLSVGQLAASNTSLLILAGSLSNQGHSITLRGSLAQATAAADVVIDTAVSRTAGKLLSIQNAAVEKAYVNPDGAYINPTGFWDDVPCRIAQAGGASALTFEAYRDTNFFAYFLRHDQDDTLHLEWQMPHTWDPSTNVKPHIHITPMVNPAADQVVRFTGKYAWCQVGVETPADASWTSFTVDTTITTTDAFKEKVVSLADVAPPSNPKESNILLMWLRRPGNSDAADTYTTSKATGTAAANVKVASIDAHIRKNKRGTLNEIP